MCYYVKITNLPEKISMHYNKVINDDIEPIQSDFLNGFSNPMVPVALLEGIKEFQWGLLPFWAKDNSIQRKTLNARIETIRERNAYRKYVENRCLLPVNGFYEWKHLDGGKTKLKHLIQLKNESLFSLGCIHTNETFSIVTTAANEFMAEIHNTKKRMPIILPKELELDWLTNPNIEDFADIAVDLNATIV